MLRSLSPSQFLSPAFSLSLIPLFSPLSLSDLSLLLLSSLSFPFYLSSFTSLFLSLSFSLSIHFSFYSFKFFFGFLNFCLFEFPLLFPFLRFFFLQFFFLFASPTFMRFKIQNTFPEINSQEKLFFQKKFGINKALLTRAAAETVVL